ncbi:GH116 family glycosyl-hydrolase [Gayadomonas joobiniege]|uniref:GH116 family glycosyl-hydrolase n=1 Tax=Gayadomonas joobiniege TaxID=1234606 RepID=UPI000360B1DE|nr:GH116 family glycosyl-hydrolase [Gayadomonas joobiniege]
MSCKVNNENKLCCTPVSQSRRHFLIAAGGLTLAGCTGQLWSFNKSAGENYAKAITAHDSLRGYWRFDGDYKDALSGRAATKIGNPKLVEGIANGQALALDPASYLQETEAEHLRDRAATLAFFFKVDRLPENGDDPVLMAQTSKDDVRYIIGVKNDMSALLYRNTHDKIVTRIDLPTGKAIEVGRWYHFAITSFDLDIRVYVDGFECSLVGGALEFTRRGPKKSTMYFGQAPDNDWGSTAIKLDEVACFGKGLTQAEIQKDLKQAGWQDKLAATGVLVEQVKKRQNAIRDAKTRAYLESSELTERGQTRRYTGEHLQAINFTVGGIGAGGIQFNGKGQPGIWQIATNFEEIFHEDCFLAIRTQTNDEPAVVKALQTEAAADFSPVSSIAFEGEYPFANYFYNDAQLPVTVKTEIFNPFIPMDLKNSALPCAIYTTTVTNTSTALVSVDLLAAQKNILGYDKKGQAYGGNHNKVISADGATLVYMQQNGQQAGMVLAAYHNNSTAIANWQDSQSLHSAFFQSGQLDGETQTQPSPQGKTQRAAVASALTLAPGETQSVTFVLSWYFTDTKHAGSQKWQERYGQMYNNWWPDALAVNAYVQKNLADLTARTRKFHDTLYASNLPVWLLDRLSSQTAVLRSQTCFWSKDGYFGAWEGTKSDDGCCPGNCTHVWHYAQLHARLLPELGRKMREQDYDFQTESGVLRYRHTSKHKEAADGFFGTILNTYREYQCSVDDSWLKSLWPKVKKSMNAAIEHWDPNRDGYMQNRQHNTLDGAIMGCSSWIGSLYLSALEAAARMADVMQENDLAKEYRRIRTSGKQLQNERLWNGEYYIQEAGQERVQDYLDGCHIDQVLGEWWADQINIDRNYPKERTEKAMQSLLRYNFLADFYGQSLKPRQYCEISDGGTKMITWPKNPQPIPGMKYGDEVMTGFEYGAGASMIQNGMLREGLMLIKVIADRYDGRLRTEGVTDMETGPRGTSGNPFGDDECGKYYGRSLSVWSALLALQGFIYDGPAGLLGFKPRIHVANHKSFFSGAEGYGLYSQQQTATGMKSQIEIAEGQINVAQLILTASNPVNSVQAKLNGREIILSHQQINDELQLKFAKPIDLQAGQTLDVEIIKASA